MGGRFAVTIDEFLAHASRQGWDVLAPDTAILGATVHARAPGDLRLFLERCGGVRSHAGVTLAHRIVPVQDAVLSSRDSSDRLAKWYVIAEESDATTAERVVIDLDPRRLGRCYEAFWDCLGVAGSMPVVARSFSELLERFWESDGRPYWSSKRLGLGDAYD